MEYYCGLCGEWGDYSLDCSCELDLELECLSLEEIVKQLGGVM